MTYILWFASYKSRCSISETVSDFLRQHVCGSCLAKVVHAVALL